MHVVGLPVDFAPSLRCVEGAHAEGEYTGRGFDVARGSCCKKVFCHVGVLEIDFKDIGVDRCRVERYASIDLAALRTAKKTAGEEQRVVAKLFVWTRHGEVASLEQSSECLQLLRSTEWSNRLMARATMAGSTRVLAATTRAGVLWVRRDPRLDDLLSLDHTFVGSVLSVFHIAALLGPILLTAVELAE